ncbi:hypothetical protein SUGI_0944120 [Cryptomeria japonica]|nr:hypothetical protein SUGI_0944120 [Cryptomeria japonica]
MIAWLHTGSPSDKANAVASILSLTKDNPDQNAKLSVEEGVIAPLLMLINYKDTSTVTSATASSSVGSVTEVAIRKGQEAAARALGPYEVAEHDCWALSEMLSDEPRANWQDQFAHDGVIRSLVGHLAFESLQEGSKCLVTVKLVVTIHSLVTTSLASKVTNAHTLAHL